MLTRLAIFALALAAFASAQPASAANWFEKNFWLSGPEYTAEVPLCEDDQVLAFSRDLPRRSANIGTLS
jgi:hypothetical protein